MRPVDITGQKFGRLTAVAPVPAYPRRKWRLICDCGNETTLFATKVISGNTRSCGCLMAEFQARGNVKHGLHHTKAYSAWTAIKQRCLSPNCRQFKHYGGRGIPICKAWENDFPAFFSHIGHPPSPKHSVERINNERGYEPGNVRWATQKEQTRNKRTTRRLSYQGRTQALAAWAEEYQIPSSRLFGRLARGWSMADALTLPLISHRRAA